MAKAKSAPACGCPVAAFQKMISGKYKLRIVWDLKDGPLRYGDRPVAWLGRQRRDRAAGAEPRIEGADRERIDRPQGLWRRSAQGRVPPDAQGQEFRSRDIGDQIGRAHV